MNIDKAFGFGWVFFDQIKEWIGDHCNPEDVFVSNKLQVWAEENGYIHEDDIEDED